MRKSRQDPEVLKNYSPDAKLRFSPTLLKRRYTFKVMHIYLKNGIIDRAYSVNTRLVSKSSGTLNGCLRGCGAWEGGGGLNTSRHESFLVTVSQRGAATILQLQLAQTMHNLELFPNHSSYHNNGWWKVEISCLLRSVHSCLRMKCNPLQCSQKIMSTQGNLHKEVVSILDND